MRRRPTIVVFAILALGIVIAGTVLLIGRHGSGSARGDVDPLIVIDAGHGGRDPGATCEGIEEADVDLAVARRVAALIDTDGRLALRMTRSSDVYVTLEKRIVMANNADAALYLSIHVNACDYPDVTGIETLVSEKLVPEAPAWQFAEILQDAVATATGARDRGTRSQDLYLHRASMPAAILEMGFLTNDGERRKLLDPSYQQTMAEAIYRGIVAYLAYADPDFPDEASASSP